MQVEWIIPCRYVEVHDNLGTIVGAGIDTLWVEAFPAQIQVAIAIRLTAAPDELGEDIPHSTRNVLRGPGGDVIGELEGEVTIAGEAARPDWLVGIIQPTQLGFEAPEEGTYSFEFFIDQASLAIPIHVRQQAEGEPT